jgi:hypothetical protein
VWRLKDTALNDEWVKEEVTGKLTFSEMSESETQTPKLGQGAYSRAERERVSCKHPRF